MAFEDICLSEIIAVGEIARFKSLRTWAAFRGISPVQASRLLRQIEAKVGKILFHKSNLGVLLTQDGDLFWKHSQDLVANFRVFQGELATESVKPYENHLTIASRGFLHQYFAPKIVQCFEQESDATCLRFIDMSPEETSEARRGNAIDAVIGFEKLERSNRWESHKVGFLEWKLCGRARHPLARGVTSDQLKRARIGHHIYWSNGRVVINDFFLDHSGGIRQLGHGAQTASVALSIAEVSDQLAFVPNIVARPLIESNRIVEIPIKDLAGKSPRNELYLAVNVDRISKSTLRKLKDLLTEDLRC